ncbi:hypothetical protein PG997_005323 [Apiospora hydei]|uniref:non-specific serine/threonine protein kinase n=1 Tax=Apiospora hydei TaxID=1337664 RepID=A0ABR1X4T7_9PEZI
MDHAQRTFRALTQCAEFQSDISREQRPGLKCKGGEAPYVSRIDLYQYWTAGKIDAVLRSSGSPADSDTVRDGYLQVLSILAWVQATSPSVPVLHHLPTLISHGNDDASLPWYEAPRGFPDKASFHHFHEHQWRFCPVIFNRPPYLSERLLDPSAILPISPLNGNTVPKFRVESGQHRESTLAAFRINIPDVDQTQLRHVVFKTYPDKTNFDQELKAYRALQRKNKNIVRSYGSFYWISDANIRHNTIILELAEEGSLRDLYKANDPPTTSEGIRTFWYGFLDLAEGLEALHNFNNGQTYSIIHQDLKPSNVLVFRDGNQLRFKIGDFGSSTVRDDSHPQRYSGPDTGAGKTYSPPELHLNHNVDYTVTSTVDIWAFGCIMVEAAVWLVFGEAERRRFRQLRMNETAVSCNDHQALGCSDTFHDGSVVLKCVRGLQDRIEHDCRRSDTITTQIVEYVINSCLIDVQARPISRQVVHALKRIIYPAHATGTPLRSAQPNPWQDTSPANRPTGQVPGNEARQAPQRPPLQPIQSPEDDRGLPRVSIPASRSFPPPTNAHPRDRVHSNPPSAVSQAEDPPLPTNTSNGAPEPLDPPSHDAASQPSLPIVTVDEAHSWMLNAKKTGIQRTLPGWESIKGTMGGRDYIIVVDNSKHMQGHRDEVIKVAKVMSYLMKTLDPNGVEVVSTSKPKNNTTWRRSSKVEGLLTKSFAHGMNADCQMEQALTEVLKGVKPKLQKSQSKYLSLPLGGAKASGVSVYVLTSGVWDRSADGTCGVEKPIESLIACMREHDVGRTEAAIQFVRFGSDARGMKRLDALDDDLPNKEVNRGL